MNLNPEKCTYTSCYCEENVWHLCKQQVESDSAFVVFISNANMTVRLWKQNQASGDSFVQWDYHVIFVKRCQALGADPEVQAPPFRVFDLDSQEPLGVAFCNYAKATFRPHRQQAPHYRPFFRVVPAETYLRVFASDRSHMRMEDGTWLSEPPTYPVIKVAACEHNLPTFWSMGIPRLKTRKEQNAMMEAVNEGDYGVVMNLEELMILFGDNDS